MPWYVYDYDKKGVPIQRGPYSSSARAQRELDHCESQVAEMQQFSTRDPSRAKRQFKEMRCQKLGLTEGIRHFKSPAVRERDRTKEQHIPLPSSSVKKTLLDKPVLAHRPVIDTRLHH
jgi:hypothetical protein